MTPTETEIGAFLVVLARVGGLMATAPVIGDAGVPKRARLVVVLALGFALAPNRPGVAYDDVPGLGMLELAVGLASGIVARFILSSVSTAGQLMGLSLGLGFAAGYDARAGESATSVSSFLNVLAGIAFLGCGGLEAIVRAAGQGPATPAQLVFVASAALEQGTASFGHGLALAAPIVMASLVGNLGLAVLGRAAPSINVFSVSLAAILVLGGFVLVAGASGLEMTVVGIARDAISFLAP